MPDPISIPDEFTDPTLYDADEQVLVDRALAHAQTKLPEWTPREGNTEVVLTESLALLVAEQVYAINRLPEQTLEGLLLLYGLARDPGTPATGTARFTIADSLGFTIPLGTELRVTIDETAEEIDFITTASMAVAPGTTMVDVPMQAVENGIGANGLAAGTLLQILDAVPYVESAVTVALVTGGREPETDQTFYDRGAAMLSRLTSTLVLPAQFRASALEDPAVGFATVYDLYNPAGGGVPGDNLGHVTVAVVNDAGVPLSGPQMDTLESTLTSRTHAGLDVHVVAPAYQAVNVAASVIATSGADTTIVDDAVTAAVTAYLAPKNWVGKGTKVYRNELISLIDQVPGVERVVSITAPAADVALTGLIVLPQPGTIGITVA